MDIDICSIKVDFPIPGSPEIKITSPSTLNIYKPTWYRGHIYNITWKIINTET